MYKKYLDFVQQQKVSNVGLQKIVDLLLSLKDKQIVTFCHDDPDGITSGIIFKRLTDKLAIKNILFFPYSFVLSRKEVLEIKEKYSPEALFIIDKGTIQDYNSFAEIIKNVVVIDHHPKIGEQFDKIILYNPAIPTYVRTSGCLLVHILSTLFNNTNKYDDFICLIGMKCDWAVDPLNNDIAEFCLPFYEERIKPYYLWLEEKRNDLKPTMFDIKNQNITCLLNQISELFFAVTGGGFQYFYNSYNEKLKNIDQPKFCYEAFLTEFEIKKFNNINEFINFLPQQNKEIITLIYDLFLSDWEKTEKQFDEQTILSKEINGIKIFLFFGKDIKLMPLVGSKKLYQYKNDKDAVIIMFNIEKDGSIHISFRGTTDKIHLGKIASSVADRLNSKLQDKTKISGGGHPFAAECKIKNNSVDFLDVLYETINFLTNYK